MADSPDGNMMAATNDRVFRPGPPPASPDSENGLSATEGHDGERIALPEFISAEALPNLPRERLVAHCLELQEACEGLDSDNKFLSWELRESSTNLLRFARVAQIAHYLNASDLDTVADLAVNQLPLYLNCAFAAFYLYDAAEDLFTLYRSTVPLPKDDKVSGSQEGHFVVRLLSRRAEPYLVYRSGDIYVTSDAHSPDSDIRGMEVWRDVVGDTALVFPLLINRQDRNTLRLGGLIIGKCGEALTENDAEVSMMFIDLLSSSLYNAKLVQQLNQMASTDALTSLSNRRHFLFELDKAMAQSKRNSHPLSLAMLDIDHFKSFNDTYGHLGGDQVLIDMGQMLKDSVRSKVDVPARYGGEEFIVVMPYTRIDQALFMAERIRTTVQARKIEFEGKELSVTCSIGVAEYIPGEPPASFIDRADAALYHAKKCGRNQVSTHAGE